MVESLSADFMERYGDVRNLTPFLNGLSRESLVFDHFYATGKRTVRGLEAVSEIDDAYERDEPIFLHVMTTSNDRPYTFPEGRVTSPTGGRGAAVR